MALRYLTSAAAQQLDRDLMSVGGFSIDQLMELAGLSCAEAVYHTVPPTSSPRVLIACGPGNQGGDGLVAARHLQHFGYSPQVWYPKRNAAPLFEVGAVQSDQRLVTQLQNLGIEFVDNDAFDTKLETTDAVLDAIFGFSFRGEPREPFKSALEAIVSVQKRRSLPVLSVDIPSSWGVDSGNGESALSQSFMPDVLISLTAPKLGSRAFRGKHYLGGRFVDGPTAAKYDLNLPKYPGTSQIVDITGVEPSN
ncbi:NAD(P)H-hydrate epimerase [Malassezia cuniculi]|uniref:NAD(P)H-hydrate epimerase n=1 Tax=Malassezia cuniculi TaxID=948313 RepID=A0AAF0ERZ0_9BASI|nr:NAD(P)H-hydrate epimerase [Malassezia cuniculi]